MSKADESDNWRRRPVAPQANLEEPPKQRRHNWSRHGNTSKTERRINMDDLVPPPPRPRRTKVKKIITFDDDAASHIETSTKADRSVTENPDKPHKAAQEPKEAWNHFARDHDTDKESSTDEEWVISSQIEPKKPKFKSNYLLSHYIKSFLTML
jgi:hypothetical protein